MNRPGWLDPTTVRAAAVKPSGQIQDGGLRCTTFWPSFCPSSAAFAASYGVIRPVRNIVLFICSRVNGLVFLRCEIAGHPSQHLRVCLHTHVLQRVVCNVMWCGCGTRALLVLSNSGEVQYVWWEARMELKVGHAWYKPAFGYLTFAMKEAEKRGCQIKECHQII